MNAGNSSGGVLLRFLALGLLPRYAPLPCHHRCYAGQTNQAASFPRVSSVVFAGPLRSFNSPKKRAKEPSRPASQHQNGFGRHSSTSDTRNSTLPGAPLARPFRARALLALPPPASAPFSASFSISFSPSSAPGSSSPNRSCRSSEFHGGFHAWRSWKCPLNSPSVGQPPWLLHGIKVSDRQAKLHLA